MVMEMLLNTLFKHWTARLFSPETMHRQTYEAFKRLLRHDGEAHDLMAELEVLYHEGKRLDLAGVRQVYGEFSDAIREMVTNLAFLAPADATTLLQYYRKMDFYVRFLLASPEQPIGEPYVLRLADIESSQLCGNKAFNIAMLRRQLSAPVPDGFVITTNAFHRLVEYNNLRGVLDALLAKIDIEDTDALQEVSHRLQSMILSATIPPEVEDHIQQEYRKIEAKRGTDILTAVRSSAVSEDGEHSFAGQYHTELAVTRERIVAAYLKVLASKYAPEALFYRITLGLADEEASMAVLVLAMVDAESSGVVYTNMAGREKERELVIYAIYGLGEVLVAGRAVADRAGIDRESGKILWKKKGRQSHQLIMRDGRLVNQPVPESLQQRFCLSSDHLIQLGRWALEIEELYGEPQDIEWAVTPDGALFILQSRPFQDEKNKTGQREKEQSPQIDLPVLYQGGQRASGGRAAGPVVQLDGDSHEGVEAGSVLVTGSTPPSLVRLLNKIVAVVAEKGTTASHFSTVCREFSIPLIIGAQGARQKLPEGEYVTVDADALTVYAGVDASIYEHEGQAPERDLPYFRRLGAVMKFITPLNLVDPESSDFRPEACRSMHDILRYTHERAMRCMFSLGEKIGSRSAKQLVTDLPLHVHLLDVGGGICEPAAERDKVSPEQICCRPFKALWKGLSHPGVDWQSHSHFDWKSFDEIALAGGVAGKDSGDFASYAIIGDDYLNFNIRFGYHFTLVDTLCGDDRRTNFCMLRFAGGGGVYTGRSLRLEFLEIVLTRLGFSTSIKADLLDARITELECDELCATLDMLGRLLGATKLMDMVLKDEEDVDRCVQLFFLGRYSFAKELEHAA